MDNISLSFANVKEPTYEMAIQKINLFLSKLYIKHIYILESGILHGSDITFFKKMLTASENINDIDMTLALNQLSRFLYRYYGEKKVIILLDEYDPPLQEAFINGYWDQMGDFTERLFNSTFKANPYMERAIMIGITSMSKETMFSDFHNLNIITTTLDKYVDSFGFTEKEVFEQLDESEDAIWSLLLASGYLKVEKVPYRGKTLKPWYHLCITNLENRYAF